jgi:hypothetical protein
VLARQGFIIASWFGALAAALALGAVWALAQLVASAKASAIVETENRLFIVEPPYARRRCAARSREPRWLVAA